MRIIVFLGLLGLGFNTTTAQEYRQLSWEEKLSEQYRYQFPSTQPTASKTQADRAQRDKNNKMRTVLTQADKLAQQEATQGRWERPDYIQLHQQQRRLEAQIDLYQREYPSEKVAISKYQDALARVKADKSKQLPYWTK